MLFVQLLTVFHSTTDQKEIDTGLNWLILNSLSTILATESVKKLSMPIPDQNTGKR